MGGWRRLPKRLRAVTVGYKMLLQLVLAVRETVAGHRLSALEGGVPPPLQCIPGGGQSFA